MFNPRPIRPLTVLAVACAIALPAVAETFDVRLAGRVIGQLETAPDRLESALDNTPLGAADGWFRASRAGQDYSALNSDGRAIDVRFADGQVVAATVTPLSEATELTNPAAVPADVVDPVTGLNRVITASDCPSTFRMYDGRRAILIEPTERAIEAGELVCRMNYTVTDGPGHVSPFRLTNLRMEARYALDGSEAGPIDTLRISAGPFAVLLVRR